MIKNLSVVTLFNSRVIKSLFILTLLGIILIPLETAAKNEQKKTIYNCNENILIDMVDIKLQVPKCPHTHIALQNGSTYGKSIDDYNGEKSLKNVISVRMVTPELPINAGLRLNYFLNKKPPTAYETYERLYKNNVTEDQVTKISDQIEKVQFRGVQIYILSAKEFPTANGEPIVLNCTDPDNPDSDYLKAGMCSTNYAYKKNTYIDYTFDRGGKLDVNYPKIVEKVHRLIDKMKNQAKRN